MNMVVPSRIILINTFDIPMHLGFCLVLGREPLHDPRVLSGVAIASNQHNEDIHNTMNHMGHPHIACDLALNHGANRLDWQHVAVAFLDGFVLRTQNVLQNVLENVKARAVMAQRNRY